MVNFNFLDEKDMTCDNLILNDPDFIEVRVL